MKEMLKYYKPYIPFIFLIIAALFGQALCELALPGYMSDIINNGIIKGSMPYIYKTGGLMLLVALAVVLCTGLAGLFSARVAAKSSRDIRGALFKRVTAFSAAELEQFSTASLITRSTNDVQMVQQSTVMILRMAFFAPIMGIGAVIKALRTSVPLSWTIALAVLVILLIMGLAFILVMPKFKVLQSKLDRINLIMQERLSGLLVVRAFTSEPYEEDRFDKANVDLKKINMFVNRAMSFMMPALMLVMNLSSILIVWVGAKLIDAQNLLIGDMLAFMQYAMQIIMSFLFITMMFIMIPRAAVSGQRIGAVLSVKPTIEDAPDCKEISHPAGVVEFRDVSFAYPDAEERTLSNISFVANPGETTAIIGGTGSGKSSLISLIPRFYDVTEGKILLDGTDIRDISQKSLRDAIGYVPQKGVLFSGTIASNLQYGKEDASPEDLSEAARTAQAMTFIEEKTEGFDEPVAQGGTTVSGGQKQRLSIARALVKKPQIYIFDDSFSALDFKTDAALREALKEKVGGSTMIIVAQRINTIMDADKIVVLDEGKVAGIGTHQELLESCRVYQEIASSQLSEEELGKGAHING
ncbi:ABC transporter ATP-binding protein/permease [Anaerovorax odorimutans]|uniref:ABC transporter ATP-binding protein/permease n=1 Tax=Anaerovorax odorimutans TaxID=109327 RepID=A0ABT1RT73_9FIRM|nr:ABC transporter ATP-binding protein [Anaerovorax odorimutans]MCQ4638413.1 ABC transporter ATP-binding protein/permease [Anaerovorax odorimutans]